MSATHLQGSGKKHQRRSGLLRTTLNVHYISQGGNFYAIRMEAVIIPPEFLLVDCGHLVQVLVTSGLGGMSGAQAKAAVICGCVAVIAEVGYRNLLQGSVATLFRRGGEVIAYNINI